MASRHRLMILCELHEGELSVSALQEALGLGQSSLSQHLARLRADGLVETRRVSQTIFLPDRQSQGLAHDRSQLIRELLLGWEEARQREEPAARRGAFKASLTGRGPAPLCREGEYRGHARQPPEAHAKGAAMSTPDEKFIVMYLVSDSRDGRLEEDRSGKEEGGEKRN